MKENLKIRKLTENDRETRVKLMRYAFETSKNTYDNLIVDKYPMDWYYGAFDKEAMVATAGIIPFEIRMRSRDFKMHGVGGVASKPEYRNRGIIREIMIGIKSQYLYYIHLSFLFMRC
jgi:predicted acetyltransferase